MWKKKTSPEQVHWHVQEEIFLKGTCTCSFSALVEALKRFSIGKLNGFMRRFLFSLNSPGGNSGWVGTIPLPSGAVSESHQETARKWDWCPGCSHSGVVYCIFLIFYLCLMVVKLLHKLDLSTCPESQHCEHCEQSLVYLHWPLQPTSYLPHGTNSPNFRWKFPTYCC